MLDASSLPNGTPVWITVIVAVLGLLLTFSERAAKLKGPLGAAARWWTTKQEQAIDKAATIDAKIESAAERRYGKRMDDMELEMEGLRTNLREEREASKKDREKMKNEHREELEKVRLERDAYFSWSEELLRWVRRNTQWMAEQGIAFPPPPLPSFATWYEEWLKNRKAGTSDAHN